MKDANKIMDDILVTIDPITKRVLSLNADESEQAARIVKDLSEAYLNLMQAKSLELSMTAVLKLKEKGG